MSKKTSRGHRKSRCKNMKVKTLSEFKRELVKAINNQDIEHFGSLIIPSIGSLTIPSTMGCPFFHPFFERDRGNGYCPDCPLSDKDGPKELMGTQITCLVGSMKAIFSDYVYYRKINKETALSMLILDATKLLAYLESKE